MNARCTSLIVASSIVKSWPLILISGLERRRRSRRIIVGWKRRDGGSNLVIAMVCFVFLHSFLLLPWFFEVDEVNV